MTTFTRISLVMLLPLLATISQGQTIQGRVLDDSGMNPVPYANIGIVNRGIGTVADGNGLYRLDITNASDADTLQVSCIGYASRQYIVSVLRNQDQALDVILEEKIVNLEEVTIRPKNMKSVVLGNDFSNKNIAAGFSSDDLGSEAGVVMQVKNGKTYYLNTAGFYVAKCEYDSILFRMNIYSYKNGKVGDVLHNLPIYIKVEKGQTSIQLNLRPYQLEVTDDFVMTLEWIQDLSNRDESFMFCAGFMGGGITWRKTSQDRFQKLPGFGIGMYCIAEFEKN